MLDIAMKIRPHACCLVPEKRTERTTEGGLDVVGGHDYLKPYVAELGARGHPRFAVHRALDESLQAAASLKAPVVELHTGAWCDAVAQGEARTRRLRIRTPAGRCGADARAGARVPRRPRPRLRYRAHDRRAARDRRAQHRPFSGRRGDLRRARGDRARMRAAMDEGRRGAMIIGLGSDLCDIRRIEETLAVRRPIRDALLHRNRAAQSDRRAARRLLRQALRRQGSLRQGARHGAQPRRLLARHGRGQPAERQADDATDRRRGGAAGGDHAAGTSRSST